MVTEVARQGPSPPRTLGNRRGEVPVQRIPGTDVVRARDDRPGCPADCVHERRAPARRTTRTRTAGSILFALMCILPTHKHTASNVDTAVGVVLSSTRDKIAQRLRQNSFDFASGLISGTIAALSTGRSARSKFTCLSECLWEISGIPAIPLAIGRMRRTALDPKEIPICVAGAGLEPATPRL